MKKIIGIKCQNKFYITEVANGECNRYISLKEFLIDKVFPMETFHSKWVVVEKEPEIIQNIKDNPTLIIDIN